MEEPETQAPEGAGGRAFRRARLLPFGGASVAVAAAAFIVAGGGATARVGTDVWDVTALASNEFTPSELTIKVGDTVRWTNSGGGRHNVRFDNGSFDDPPDPITTDWTVSRSFDSEGSFGYYCELHTTMRGTVNVTAVTGPPGPLPPAPPPPGGSPPGVTPPGGTPSPGGPPPPGAPGVGKSSTTVTLQVSDATPARGARVRFFGTVRPAQDGRVLQLQRRARGGSYRTVERIRLADAGNTRSKFGKRLRVLGDAMFRARLSADGEHEAGTSRTRRVNVR
jgi:plastocyanin